MVEFSAIAIRPLTNLECLLKETSQGAVYSYNVPLEKCGGIRLLSVAKLNKKRLCSVVKG